MKRTLFLGGAALLVFALTVDAQAPTTGDTLLPPNAKPGDCYARVWVPATYETKEEKVATRDASENMTIVPATYETVTEKVLVREASEKLEVVPAKYEWVEEKVLVREASKKLTIVPAVYETVTEQVVDTPEHTIWKTGRGPIERVSDGTGEIMCLVTVPAATKAVNKRVLKTPAQVQEVEVPAQYTTVRKQVLKTPATTTKVEIPAKYETVEVRKVKAPARAEKQAVPAEYRTVQVRTLVQNGQMQWQPILCETNTTPGVVSQIQTALKGAGFNPGPIDGIIGAETRTALRDFQQKMNLAVGGITMETLKALNVRI